MSYSALIKKLSDQHYKHELSFDEYRDKRNAVLIQVDIEHNGADLPVQSIDFNVLGDGYTSAPYSLPPLEEGR